MGWKAVLAILTATAALSSTGYTMIVPFLPLYLMEELAVPREDVGLWSGAIFSVSFAISAAMAPLWGRFSDTRGRKVMILRSSLLLALTYLLGGLVTTPLQLFMVRVLQGIASGVWPASLALMSACAPRDKVGISMGVMQSANITGAILGPAIGGLLAGLISMRAAFFAASASLTIITLLVLFLIREPPRAPRVPAPSGAPRHPLLSNRPLLTLMLCSSLAAMVVTLLQPIIPLYVIELAPPGGNASLLSGMVFSLGALAGALAAPFWGRFGQRLGFHRTLTASLAVAGAIILGQSLPMGLWIFAALQFACGLGFAGIFPSANAMLIAMTPAATRGSALGVLFSFQQVGNAIGPLVAGALASLLPLNAPFACSGLLLLAAALVMQLRRAALAEAMQAGIEASREGQRQIMRKVAATASGKEEGKE
ncbi:MAG: MFS transporter [Succinivibrionaceae bacterium]|nr:MFS transporter [Succinivibrionaceae bacterium]